MKIDEFNSLIPDEKALATWEGTFLEMREENGFRIGPYDLGGFMWGYTTTPKVEILMNERGWIDS